MLKKYRNFSKSHIRKQKKKEYDKFLRVLKNNLSRKDRATYGTVSLQKFKDIGLKVKKITKKLQKV